MAGKRSRTDGHLSKEEYEESFTSPYAEREGAWRPANDSVLAQRKMVKPKMVDRRKEYMDAVRSLNVTFTAFVKSQVGAQADVRLVENAEEYLAYVQQLRSRYLREQGEVFTFGNSECGQCAHGDRGERDIWIRAPRVLLQLRNRQVCNVACGGLHTVAVTSSGAVYTWGCDDDKALGRPGPEGSPVIVDDLRHEVITAVSAGDCHTAALTLEGRVYAWGCFKDKDNTSFFHADIPALCKKHQSRPLLISSLRDVREIASGANHCLALLADATAYSWGIGESGQLGRKVTYELKEEAEPGERPEYNLEAVYNQHLKPQPMQLAQGYSASGVKGIACGSNHSVIILALDAEVYSCGLNNYGQLGLGDVQPGQDYRIPELEHIKGLDRLQITEVAAGQFHTMALSGPTGKVYAFGRADAGQLGIGKAATDSAGASFGQPQEVQFPRDHKGRLPFVISIAAGGEHSIAISDKPNEVYTWGYGDMGALGHSKLDGEQLPRAIDFTRLHISEIKVLKAAGGGQHSVILANVPATYMETATKRKRQADDEYDAKLTAHKRQRAAAGQQEDEDEVLMED